MNPRTCIVTREEHAPDRMIRFVIGPENRVFPDLRRKLPGRGCWVMCDRNLVAQALEKGHFARGFKMKVVADDDLPQQVDELMHAQVLNTIALAKKAGVVTPGQAKAEALVRSGDAGLLLMASDAGEDGVAKMGFAIRTLKLYEDLDIPVFRNFSSEELDRVTGGTNVMHLAVQYGGMADKIVTMLERLMCYRGEIPEKRSEM